MFITNYLLEKYNPSRDTMVHRIFGYILSFPISYIIYFHYKNEYNNYILHRPYDIKY